MEVILPKWAKNSEPEDEQKLCRLGAKYNKYTLCDIVPRLIIEARPALPYTTVITMQWKENVLLLLILYYLTLLAL